MEGDRPWFIFLTPKAEFGGAIWMLPDPTLPPSEQRLKTGTWKFAARFDTREDAERYLAVSEPSAKYARVPTYCPEAPPPPAPKHRMAPKEGGEDGQS